MQHICANTKYEKYANVCVPVFRHFLHSKYIDIEANTNRKYRNTQKYVCVPLFHRSVRSSTFPF